MDKVIRPALAKSDHEAITRRDLLRKAVSLTATMTMASALLQACAPSAQPAPTIAPKAPAAAPTAAVAPTTAPAAKAPAAAATAPAPAAAPAKQPKTGGTMTHGSHQEPNVLWGLLGGIATAQESERIWNSKLVDINDKLELIPDLAVEVPTAQNGGISADGRTYTFKLRKDVKWHDGKPFTAKDVKFTQELIVNPTFDVKSRLGFTDVEKVETPDDYTVVYQLKGATAIFLDRIADASMLPQHILGGLSGDALNKHEFFRKPIGLGPFKFKEWAPASHITYVKNPDYFRGAPNIDTFIYKIVLDSNALLNQLDTGEADSRFRMMTEQINIVKGLKNLRLVSTASVDTWTLWWNHTKPQFKEKKVRQALAHGFDREGIAKTVLKGLAEVAWQLIPSQSWAFNPNVAKYPFDQAKAKQLLDEAGWKPGADGIREKDGARMSFEIVNIPGEQERVQILSYVQRQWKEIGVDARIKPTDVATILSQKLPKLDYEMGYTYTGGGRIEPNLSSIHMTRNYEAGPNYAGYSNPAVDQMLQEVQRTVDKAKRKEIYFKLQEVLADDVVYIFLTRLANHTVLNNRVQGYKPGATGSGEFWNINEWWLDK